MITLGHRPEHRVTANSLFHPADSAGPGMAGVGAVAWDAAGILESTSSQGPSTDGRTKPDLAALKV